MSAADGRAQRLEGGNEGVDLVGGVRRREGEAQAGLSPRHGGWTDGWYEKSRLLQGAGRVQSRFLLPKDQRQNRAGRLVQYRAAWQGAA